MPRRTSRTETPDDLGDHGRKVGAETARLLAGAGEEVRVLVRDPDGHGDLVAGGVEVVTGNLGDPASVERAVAGVDRDCPG